MDQGAKRGRSANDLSHVIVTAALKVHSALGPGLLESACETCLLHELTKSGLKVSSQVGLPLVYDGLKLDIGYRLDLLVEDLVIVEIKVSRGHYKHPHSTDSLLLETERKIAWANNQLQRPSPERRH